MSESVVRPRSFVLPGVLLVLILLVFAPSLLSLWDRWLNDSRYNHGYLVPLFSAYLLYRKKDDLLACPAGSAWGLALILVGLAIRSVGVLIYFDWLDAIALLPCLAGLIVLYGGRQALLITWPALAFLVFMIPMPFRLETALSHPLQRLATALTSRGLRVLGYPAFSEGNIIRMDDTRVNVAEACSGLSMLMIFFALCTAVAMLTRRPLWERLLVVAAAVPIALLSNVFRIMLTAVLYYYNLRFPWNNYLVAEWVHDYAGWIMMPVALVLLWLLSILFNWMFPLRRDEDDDPVFTGFAAPSSEQFQTM